MNTWLRAAHDGTLYATIIYPVTLLKIDGYQVSELTGGGGLAVTVLSCDFSGLDKFRMLR